MLQNWIGSLGRILTRKPPQSPKGEVSMHGKIRDIQWVQEAKNGKCFQPFELIEHIEPFERFS